MPPEHAATIIIIITLMFEPLATIVLLTVQRHLSHAALLHIYAAQAIISV